MLISNQFTLQKDVAMKPIFAFISATLLLTACQAVPTFSGSPSSAIQAQRNRPQAQAVPGEFVVKLQAGLNPLDYAKRQGLELVMPIGLNMYLFKGSASLQQLQINAAVVWAEPNFQLNLPPMQVQDAPRVAPFSPKRTDLPNDPLLPAQYGFELMGTGQIWREQPGRPEVIVAVIDSGVDGSHPEFAGQLLPGMDFTEKQPVAGGQVDGYGHGTHVAGVIGARANNGQGVAGLAPGCKILPVRIFNNWGHSESGRSAAAVIWAVDHGAKVINASWGSPSDSESTKAAIQYALAKDVVLVAAVGNSGNEDPKYPGALEEVIGVSATNADDRWASFSTFGDWVDLAAPGKAVLSTYPLALGNGYKIMEGTSMAAPHVSAAAAILRSQHPDWNVAQVRAQLEQTAKDVIMTGKDKYSGYGRVDLGRAVLETP